MIHNRKQAEQVLNEILLRMSYDISKTLSENKIILNEQPLPLDYYYYDTNGNLKTLPNLVTNYPSGSTPAKKAYPSITNGSQYPKQRISALSGFGGQPKPKTISADNSIQTRFDDQRIVQRDNTYVSPQNLMGGGAPTKPQVLPPDWKSKMNDYGYTTPQDATYVSPEYLGIKNPEMIKMAKKWEEEKRNSKPVEPKSEVIMYDPNKYPHPTPKWVYKGKEYVKKEDAFAQYDYDLKEWKKKYADGFEGWVARNGDTVHSILGYAALGLALISITASVVLTGGLSLPAIGLSLEGATGAASLLLTTADAGLYAYEGDTRMAVFVGLLGLFDVAQILRAVKGLKVLESEIDVIRNKAIQNSNRLTNGNTKLTDVFTEREILILKSIDPAIIRGEVNILGKAARQQAMVEFGYYMKLSPKYFASSLLKLKTYGLLGKLFLVIDGIQISYNALYNALSDDDKELQSLTLLLIKYAFTKQETQSQIQANNDIIAKEIQEIPEENSTKILADAAGLKFDSVGVTVDEGSLSLESLKKYYDSIPLPEINSDEQKLLPGAFKIYSGTNKSIPFKTKEEGDKFRVWFNENYPEMSKILQLDSTGSFNNFYIKRAYNIPLEENKIIGDIYQENINTTEDPEGDISGDGWN